jgi:hypothetical protein
VRSLFPVRSTESAERGTEATIDQLIATGAAGTYGIDPIDGDAGFVRVGQTGRQIPIWTREKMRAFSVSAYRSNPMARAIIDTYTAFVVGDSGLTIHALDPDVQTVIDDFWHDPRVDMAHRQEAFFREHLIYGETLLQMLVGPTTGVCRINPLDPTRITDVELLNGNVLWPAKVHISRMMNDDLILPIAQVDDLTGLRAGDAVYWRSFNTLVSDQRGDPFLGPIIDDLDSYDTVLNNLVDRTSLMRYMVWDVEIDGDQKMVEKFVRDRGGTHVPQSGSIEVHNKSVQWTPRFGEVGAAEDSITGGSLMTNIAGGAGLAKTWLAEPDGANRATSLTMAEPVRRRVGSVQNMWLHHQEELLRYVVDQSVAAGRLPATVTVETAPGSASITMPTSRCVRVHGPEVAAADSEVTAAVLVQLAQSLTALTVSGVMAPQAARVAAKKAWEQFVGIPYSPDLDTPDGSTADDLADVIEKAEQAGNLKVTLKL